MRRVAIGALVVDFDGCRAIVDGLDRGLTATQFRLLAYLLDYRGHLRSRQDVLRDVLGYSPRASTRTLETHLHRLRAKLGTARDLIQTVRGLGYRVRAGRSDEALGPDPGPAPGTGPITDDREADRVPRA